MTEYAPWYLPASALVRCLTCGALVSSGDTETHSDWHEKIEFTPKLILPETPYTDLTSDGGTDPRGLVC